MGLRVRKSRMVKSRDEYKERMKLLEMKLKLKVLLVILMLKFESPELWVTKILRNGVMEK